jgi:L-asparaginase
MKLRILLTGGTFEKVYFPLTGQMDFKDSVVSQLLAEAQAQEHVTIEQLFLIDSLDMNAGHRERLLTACESMVESACVIIHGTDTMCETAKFLQQAQLSKTIVLTGAMVPARIANSDAAFNLGFAMAQASHLKAGVFVAMNGKVFTADNCRKNRDLGCFESLDC